MGLNGADIHSEPRGLLAGYKWPQYAVHRGKFHMLLHDLLVARAGPQAVRLGARVAGYETDGQGVVAQIENAGRNPRAHARRAADRRRRHSFSGPAQMHPTQPPIHWGGALMWRGTTWAKPIRTGASFIGLGTHRQRMVIYPISYPDPKTGLAMINWIAEVTMDNSEGWSERGWFRGWRYRGFHPSFRGLAVGLARCPGHDPRRGRRVQNP